MPRRAEWARRAPNHGTRWSRDSEPAEWRRPNPPLAPPARVAQEQTPDTPTEKESLTECLPNKGVRIRLVCFSDETRLYFQQPFVSDRWTLVDAYERDGKQYLVATQNGIRVPKHTALSPRESQALGLSALGHSNKLVAYTLGITASTVGVLLHRAAEKLGTHSRPELLARFRQLEAPQLESCKAERP
jgi:DNA-binding CsgD family transcriptional regulator